MALELYLDLLSQPCRSVYIFAKKNNIPFQFKQLVLLDGEHYGEEFGKVTMIRKVPAMRDGDFCLIESIAIMQYLAEKFKTPDQWYPADLQQRALVNEYLSWQHAALRYHGCRVFWLKLMFPKVLSIEVPQDRMDTALADLSDSLRLVEEKFIQDKPFIAGNQISMADLVAIVEIMQPVGAGLDVFEGRPKLSAWRDRVRAAVGKELFDEAHKTVVGAQEYVRHVDPKNMEAFKHRVVRLFY